MLVVFLVMLVAAQNTNPQQSKPDSLSYLPQVKLFCGPADRSASHITSYARYDHLLKGARVSPVEALLSDASLSYVYFGPYGQRVDLLSSLAPRMRPGVLLDGLPLYDSEVEDFDITWLPTSLISSVCYQRWSSYDLDFDLPALMLESFSPDTEIPLTRVGAWWADFNTRSIDVGLWRLLSKGIGIGIGYEDLKSAGWLPRSRSESSKYYGKIGIPTGLGDLGIMMLRYNGYWDLPNSYDRHKDQRDQVALRFKIKGSRNLKVDFWHISDDKTHSQWLSSIRVDSFEATMQTAISSGIGIRTTLGYSGKRYQDSDVERIHLSDSYASIWVKLSQEITHESLRIWAIRSSLHGTSLAGLLTFDYKWSDRGGLALTAKRSWIFPKVSDFILGKGCFKQPLVSIDVQSDTYYDLGFSKMGGYCFFRKIKPDPGDDDALTPETKICGAGMELNLIPKQGFDLKISYSVAKSDPGRCGHCDVGHVLGWNLDLKRIITQHVSLGFAFPGRWVSSYDFERANLDCFESIFKDDKQYIYATPVVYVEIDRTFCFVRSRNAFDHRIDSPCEHYDLPGRTLEVGMIWHLLD